MAEAILMHAKKATKSLELYSPGILTVLAVIVFCVLCWSPIPPAPPTTASAEELVFEPNPVEPARGLNILLRLSPTGTKGTQPVVRLRGVGGSGESDEYWRQGDRITLHPGGPGEWVAGCISPRRAGVYPAEVSLGKVILTSRDWLLRVYPAGFLREPGFATPEEAVKARFARDFPNCTILEVKPRPLLPDDLRDPDYHRLFMVTFYSPRRNRTLPAGAHTYFYYVVKDGPIGAWRVIQSGTGP